MQSYGWEDLPWGGGFACGKRQPIGTKNHQECLWALAMADGFLLGTPVSSGGMTVLKSKAHKYPRTPHLPWSPGGTSDDAYLFNTAHFDGRHVVVTEKMDGENTSLYRDRIHARSLDSQHHPSRDWVKALHGAIRHEIPAGWRICGENVYARHSIAYRELDSYFFVFSIWNDENCALSWSDTCEWAALLGLPTVPVLIGVCEWNEASTRELTIDPETQEGYVVRLAESFSYADFNLSLAKWVRQGHVQTDQHWMHAEIIPNTLRDRNGKGT